MKLKPIVVFIALSFMSTNLFAQTSLSQMESENYRKLFYQLLPNELKPFINYYVYLPTKELYPQESLSTKALNSRDFLEQLGNSYIQNNIRALNLSMKGGLQTKIFEDSKNQAELNLAIKNIRNHPVTLVFIPGIFQEFTDKAPFDAFFQADSQQRSLFYQHWNKMLLKNPSRDKQSSLRNLNLNSSDLGEEEVPLGELIEVSGFNFPSPSPSSSPSLRKSTHFDDLNIIYLKSNSMSMETLGDQYNKANTYIRRLEKVVKVLEGEVPPHIILLGYSRGAATVLEMAQRKSSFPVNIQKEFKGVATLGGAIYGTEAIDLIIGERKTPSGELSSNAQMFKSLKKLADSLSYDTNSSWPSLSNFAHNSLAWATFLKDTTYGSSDSQERMLPGFFFVIKRIINFAFYDFNLFQFFTDYNLNVKKFKILINELMVGVTQLGTTNRLNWWKNSHLPRKDFDYFCISGLMPSNDDFDLLENPYSYAPSNIDDKIMKNSQQELAQNTEFYLNDGQIPLHSSRIWSELNPLFSQYYASLPPMKVHWLGIYGTHHWGFALANAIEESSGQKNPFPRETLLKTLALAVALQ